jgi:hypothetical protein
MKRITNFSGRGLVLAAAVAVVASTAGCVGVRGGELEETRPWPPAQEAAAKKPGIRLSLVGKALYKSKPLPVPPATSDIWLRETYQTYVTSGLFSDVLDQGSGSSELRADVEVLEVGSGSKFLWFVTGLTVGVIPSAATSEFTWKTTFKDSAGNVRGVIEKKESATMWMQILLLFGMPFSTPGSAARGAIADMNRSTLLDALEKGYLRP